MNGPLAGMTIGLLTASASRLGGGVFEAVVSHADMVRRLGGKAHVFALEDAFSLEDAARLGGHARTLVRPVGPRQIGFAPSLRGALADAALDCLHLHGIWMYPSAAASGWAAATGRPYFISPHGMLDPWITARGKWKKAAARAVYERRGWKRATALHGLTAREGRDIARETGRSDSVIVPNAGPPPARACPDALPAPVIVYIGRIHAKKNLPGLVAGWNRAPRGDARLVIAGWGEEAAIADLRAEIARGDGSASFIGPVFGEEKARLLQSARFMVLASHSEGLPMSILEAWAEGVPVIMTAECNLPEGFSAGAGIECGYDPAAIARALAQALTMPDDDRRAMSAAALGLARERFSAGAIAQRWAEIYRGAIDSPPGPRGNAR